MTQFFATPIDKSLGTRDAWLDIDLSSDIPANATGAIIRVHNTHTAWQKFGLRKNGSTDDRYGEMEHSSQGYHIIAVDSNRKIEGKIENTVVDFWLVGYTEADATLFTNGVDKTIASGGTWLDIDLSANLPVGAVAAIFQIRNNDTQPKKWSLRKKGSTDERYEDICEDRCNTFIVGVDSNRKCQGKVENTLAKFYLMGYFTAGASETNGIDRSLGTVDTFTDITESNAPSGATGAWCQYFTSQMTEQYAARKNGSSEDTYRRPDARNTMLMVPIDSNKKWEGKISDLANDWFTLGYFSAGYTEIPKTSSIGLRVVSQKTKPSSIGLCVKAEGTNVSVIGITVANRVTKESSVGLTISGDVTKVSSIGLSISETTTKASSVGLSISKVTSKTSSVGLNIVDVPYRVSSIGLSIKGANTKESSIGLTLVTNKTKVSSVSMSISGVNTIESSIGLTIFEPALKKGLFYAKLGDTILEAIDPESFRISEEINKIPSYEFEVANSEANRTVIAANPTALLKIYWQHHGEENHIFTGIINADGIEYVSLTNIRITGFSSYVKLGWPLYKHLNSEDAEPVNTALDFHGTYSDRTDAANDPTINDTLVPFGCENHCFYIGEANPFWGLQIKYSTPGVANNAVIVIEFSKGSGIWETLDVLDETNAFTEGAGTYDVIIAHPPSDWVRNTVDGVSKFWLRWRVVSGAYTTSPKLDQIHIVNVDVYRVFYIATSARAILLDVLRDTEYTMDTIDACPEDEINLFAEYESPLRVIAAIPAALTWTDTDGSKKAYQWWIDEAKKVHIKKKRGTTHSDDITGDLTIFNNLLDYFNVSNRLIGFAKRDGLSQIRAIIEDTPSQATHALRELAVPKTELGKYITLKESLEKDIAISKDPMQRLKGSVTTEFWGLRGYEVGDTVTLHQGEWVVDEGEFQIVKVDKGPILTQLNLGISREHLEGLKSNLKRAFDISNVQMHGSTSLLTVGPETMNYDRISASEVYPAKLKIEIPSTAKKMHKVLLSWTLGPYRAPVGDTTGNGGGQSSGNVSAGGAQGSGYVGSGGAFTPDIGLDGDFIPAMLGEAHKHSLEDTIYIGFTQRSMFEVWSGAVQGGSHRHSGGGTGYPNSTDNAITSVNWGSFCVSGSCITGFGTSSFATGSHYHQNSDTGYTTPGMYLSGSSNMDYVVNIDPMALITESENETPAHIHDGVYEPKHDHAGIAEPAHNDHLYPAEPAHNDHLYPAIPDFALNMIFRIFELMGGTTLELLVNEEKVGEYDGPQTDIRIDGYLTTGSNTIEIQPIEAEVGKKGSATITGNGIMFIEPKRF